MTYLYEGMFLVDNDLVRADWERAKSMVTNMLTKHGGTVRTARRWDERALAYPIKGRRRGTYILTYAELPGSSMENLKRDLDLNESVLRYLIVRKEEVPATEGELAIAEQAPDFVVPVPPTDDSVPYQPLQGLNFTGDVMDDDDDMDMEDMR